MRSSVGFLRASGPGALATGDFDDGFAFCLGPSANGLSWATALGTDKARTDNTKKKPKINRLIALTGQLLALFIRYSLFDIQYFILRGRLHAFQDQGGDRLGL